jgi:arylformamidase
MLIFALQRTQTKMLATIEHNNKTYKVNLKDGIDISIPIAENGPRAWYVDKATIAPVINQHFIGSVALGGAVNFNQVQFNPHGHGTHTESVGHISKESFPISKALNSYFFIAQVISLKPEKAVVKKDWQTPGDSILTQQQISSALSGNKPEALIVRTLPNTSDKTSKNYSDSNFCYFESEALEWLASQGVQHLLTDLPSVDRESDGGLLKGHRAFWNYPNATRINASITEFIYVPDSVADGEYLLNLQVASFDNDAAPSRPVLFKLL